MAVPKSDLAVWLEFISSLFWPATVIVALMMFHKPLRALLARISSFKLGDTELAFQAPAVDGTGAKTPVKAEDVVHTENSTFLVESGVRDVIRESGLLDKDDEIYRTLIIFSTASQKTWIAFSKNKLFCLLDDEQTRRKGRLIQWSLPREQAEPVRAREHENRVGVGLLDIGTRTRWLYSRSLFPEPAVLEREVRNAIAGAG